MCGKQQNSQGSAQSRVTVGRVIWEKETGRFSTVRFCWEATQNWRVRVEGLDLTKCLWEVIKICFSSGGDLSIEPISLEPENTETTWPSAHLKPKDVLQSLLAKRWQPSPTCTFSTLMLGCLPNVCDLHPKMIQTLPPVQTVTAWLQDVTPLLFAAGSWGKVVGNFLGWAIFWGFVYYHAYHLQRCINDRASHLIERKWW